MFARSRTLVKETLEDGSLINTEITVCGWISNFRVQKNQGISFITLNDGSGLTDLQIIVDPRAKKKLPILVEYMTAEQKELQYQQWNPY